MNAEVIPAEGDVHAAAGDPGPLTLGAYAAQPDLTGSPASEAAWYRALSGIDGAGGIEAFYRGTLHERGPEHLAGLLPTGWHVVVTALPQAMAKLAVEPHYGLASRDPDGRREAVADIRHLLAEAARIDAVLGRRAVRAVEVHSSPRRDGAVVADARSLAQSLRELAEAADGIPLVIEHCDAMVPGRRPAKGFLTVVEECEAVGLARASGVEVGQSVNWGRSVIEGRSAATAIDHLQMLVRAGTLVGLMFSGAPHVRGALGEAWDDLHNPLREDDPSSLLDASQVRAALAVVRDAGERLMFLGAKVQDPAASADIEARLGPLSRLVELIRMERAAAVAQDTTDERRSR